MKIEERLRRALTESSLSRLYTHVQHHDFGIITAFRSAKECGKGDPYTYKDNLKRNRLLLAQLRAAGMGVTAIKGNYIENYGSSKAREVEEESFFVVDLQDKKTLKDLLLSLGEANEQDSILFGEAGQEGALYGTNNCPDAYPGYGKVSVQGGAIFGKDGEFLSRIRGRPFVFTEEVATYSVLKYPTELRGVVAESKKKWWEIDLDNKE